MRKRQVKVNIKIPARPFLGLSEEDMLEIKSMLEAAMEE
ncbi:phage virion morphogenesis protein [Paenibacillus alvei]|nr:phage virion morphogenesis protein [Paenibacillus alvei]